MIKIDILIDLQPNQFSRILKNQLKEMSQTIPGCQMISHEAKKSCLDLWT